MLQVSHTRSLLRISGLATGDTRSDLVHSCKYQEYKEMCRLPDIHGDTVTQQEVQGTIFTNPRTEPAPTES